CYRDGRLDARGGGKCQAPPPREAAARAVDRAASRPLRGACPHGQHRSVIEKGPERFARGKSGTAFATRRGSRRSAWSDISLRASDKAPEAFVGAERPLGPVDREPGHHFFALELHSTHRV